MRIVLSDGQILVSSTNEPRLVSFISLLISNAKIRSKRRPSTDLWETPDNTHSHTERCPCTLTVLPVFVESVSSHWKKLILNTFILSSRILHSTLLKTFEKSRYIASKSSPFSIEVMFS